MTFYKCEPTKAVKCKKTTCYMYGGNCCLTSNVEYAKDPNKPYRETERKGGRNGNKIQSSK